MTDHALIFISADQVRKEIKRQLEEKKQKVEESKRQL